MGVLQARLGAHLANSSLAVEGRGLFEHGFELFGCLFLVTGASDLQEMSQ